MTYTESEYYTLETQAIFDAACLYLTATRRTVEQTRIAYQLAMIAEQAAQNAVDATHAAYMAQEDN